MLKRGGRAHDPLGVEGTQAGELSVPCRACPTPHVNMDPAKAEYVQYKSSQPLTLTHLSRWWDSKFIAMDANFRQKARFRPNDERDLALGPGWATFVNYADYASYLAGRTHPDEVNAT
jgi:hypothetical protein